MSVKRKRNENNTSQEDMKTFENVFQTALGVRCIDEINIKQVLKKLPLNKLSDAAHRLKEYHTSNTDLKLRQIVALVLPEIHDIELIMKKLQHTKEVYHNKLLESAKETFPSPKKNGLINMKKLYHFIDEVIDSKADEESMDT